MGNTNWSRVLLHSLLIQEQNSCLSQITSHTQWLLYVCHWGCVQWRITTNNLNFYRLYKKFYKKFLKGTELNRCKSTETSWMKLLNRRKKHKNKPVQLAIASIIISHSHASLQLCIVTPKIVNHHLEQQYSILLLLRGRHQRHCPALPINRIICTCCMHQQTPLKVSAQLDVDHRATINHLMLVSSCFMWFMALGLCSRGAIQHSVLSRALDHTPHAINCIMQSSPTLSNT